MKKISRYLHIEKYDDKYIFFNFLSGSMFYVEENIYKIFSSTKNNFEKLKNTNLPLFNMLEKTRSIIDSQINEIDFIKFRYKRDVFLNNEFHLTINPTMDCNFKCWYCYEDHIPGFMSKEIQEQTIKYIEKLIEKKVISGIALGWFGGEPLMYFNKVIYLMSKKIQNLCKKNGLSFTNSITTNGYLISNAMIPKIKEIKLLNYQITLDGEKNIHNKTRILKNGNPTYKKIVDNINLLCSEIEDVRIILRINYKNDTLDNIQNIISDFDLKNREKIQINFYRIWQTFIDETTKNLKMKKELSFFKKEGFLINTEQYFMINKGYKCYADRYHQAVINYDGNVFKCTARDFKEKNRDGVLTTEGDIRWDSAKIAKRFSKATFENEKCLNCKLLPLCLGPCTQKYIESLNIDEICELKVKDFTIRDCVISKFEKFKENEKVNNYKDQV